MNDELRVRENWTGNSIGDGKKALNRKRGPRPKPAPPAGHILNQRVQRWLIGRVYIQVSGSGPEMLAGVGT